MQIKHETTMEPKANDDDYDYDKRQPVTYTAHRVNGFYDAMYWSAGIGFQIVCNGNKLLNFRSKQFQNVSHWLT